MKKTLYILFVVVFFVLCLVPSLGMIAAGPSDFVANEIRVPPPALKNHDGSINWNYLGDLRDYVGKCFYGRLNLINTWNSLNASVLHSTTSDSIVLGEDGWLFYSESVADMTGTNLLSERQLWCAARRLWLMQEYCESQGARFLFTVPCGKYSLYPEYAPDYVMVNDPGNRERLAEKLGQMGVNYVDLYEAFTAEEEILCWKYDSHWNSKGAALAADRILAAFGMPGDYFAGPFEAVQEHSGDLYEILYPSGSYLETDYHWQPGFTFEHTSNFRSYDDIQITTANPAGSGSLLMFRDSSGRNLYPYMAQSFENACFSRLTAYPLNMVQSTGADHVVIELAERTIDYLLKYSAVFPAPVRSMDVLEGAEPCSVTVSSEGAPGSLAGCVYVSGSLPAVAEDSCVYLVADGAVYEANPDEGGFNAWLPEGCDVNAIEVYAFM